MLGSRPHQRLGSVPPLTSVEPGRRLASDSIAVMKRRLVPRQTSVCHHFLVPSCAFGMVNWNVESAVSGEMSNSIPTVPVRPGQTPAGGPPAREETTTDVPAGGVPVLSVKGVPPVAPEVLQAPPVHVV